MEPEADAIFGHTSAASLPEKMIKFCLPTGPVIADPFISPLRFTITPALSIKLKNII